MGEKSWYANVILPFPIKSLFTYKIPGKLTGKTKPGKRAIVQFGKKKIYSALIREIHQNPPAGYSIKEIEDVLDPEPLISEKQFNFWEWIAKYYMCSLGEVMRAAIPSGLKLESETRFIYDPGFKSTETLTDHEELILQLVKGKKSVTIRELEKSSGEIKVIPIINSLFNKKAIQIEEALTETYKPRKEKYVKLGPKITEMELNNTLSKLVKAPKQLKIIEEYILKSGVFSDNEEKEVSGKQLLQHADAGTQSLNSLVNKGILQTYEKTISRLPSPDFVAEEIKILNENQQKALKKIQDSFLKNKVSLLNGVTGSGKTEVYIHLIGQQLEKGKQVLYLLPEIALTAQIINRLRKVFGHKVAAYHSRYGDAERLEIWRNVSANSEKCKIILGARSAIFLPYKNLGLVIIDEEHENSYKQFDPAPRYHARDAAIMLANFNHSNVLLGTATPSVESFSNAETGKYTLAELPKRHMEIKLPEIIIADTKEAYRKKKMRSHFTPQLIDVIEKALETNEQIILFQNRRGFSPYLECMFCSWIPQCPNCAVSLTYHKGISKLVCHYCGYSQPIPSKCPSCGNATLSTRGFGTEKIEDELAILYPETRVARMDMDTTRRKKSFETIINRFENREVDILVGTQMVSKGLDFSNVSVVGVLNADNLFNFPDFRAFERSFQLLAQVSGRAGRRNKQGIVIIQTSEPNHPVIKDVLNYNFIHMYNSQMEERKIFNYPPFCRIIKITLKHKNRNELNRQAKHLGNKLRETFGARVLGPEFPLIGKIQKWYLKTIILKIEKDRSIVRAKQLLTDILDKFSEKDTYRAFQVIIDVDPM
ncbi:MAG: primosomal protein N' [Bacteroidetes bacterium]|nr:primosomal protein N' [Bacteroidota bacterium]